MVGDVKWKRKRESAQRLVPENSNPTAVAANKYAVSVKTIFLKSLVISENAIVLGVYQQANVAQDFSVTGHVMLKSAAKAS